jgi:hypothetical protein
VTLADTQRAFSRVLLARSPAEADLSSLGGMRERWLLYRDMVRTRMRKMIATGIPRTVTALGEDAYGDLYDGWLDEAQPRTRYIREIVPAFVAFAIPRIERDARGFLADLARFESARWEVGYLDVSVPVDLAELSFEHPVTLNPTLRLLRLSHAVHAEPDPAGAYEAKPTTLLVYRRLDDDKTAWWSPTPVYADIVEGLLAGTASITDVVKAAAEKHSVAIDPPFVETLGSTLAMLVERTVILGGRQ